MPFCHFLIKNPLRNVHSERVFISTIVLAGKHTIVSYSLEILPLFTHILSGHSELSTYTLPLSTTITRVILFLPCKVILVFLFKSSVCTTSLFTRISATFPETVTLSCKNIHATHNAATATTMNTPIYFFTALSLHISSRLP